jgi:RNA polymerase sigma-70 factor (ECF subfamily)
VYEMMESTLTVRATALDERLSVYATGAASFEELYRREYPALMGMARALTDSFEASQDAVQDTMVKAFIHWNRVGRLDRPGGWCYRILMNVCRSRLRRERTAQRYLQRARRDEVTEGPAIEFAGFWAAVRRLPDRPQTVVVLYYVGDRPVGEIASILNVPEGTVKSDLARARIVLAAELK